MVPYLIVRSVVILVAAVVVVFALRRVIFLLAALLPPRDLPKAARECASITLVIAACNEAAGIDRTLQAVSRLDYPPDRLFVMLVNDCSDDRTGEHLTRWAAGRSRACAIDLADRVGKPRAVHRGIQAAPMSQLVAVVDADVQLRRDALRRLNEPFADETVGAVAGFLSPNNAETSATARYSAVETWVHQLITSAAKDWLDLNPPTLGGSAIYRRAALNQIGWFGSMPSGDDIRATVALTRAGWRTRFVFVTVGDTAVAARLQDYWRQHIRWARDTFETSRERVVGSTVRLPPGRRIEMLMVSAGYADRVALLAAVGLGMIGELTLWLPVAYLGLRGAEVYVAVRKAGTSRGALAFLAVTPVFFVIDIVASLTAAIAHVARRPRVHAAPGRSEPTI